MTTIYKFGAGFTKSGVATAPSSAPVCTVVDENNNVLANAQATTALSNLPGVYLYQYSGADGLNLVAMFHTTETTMDQQDLFSYTPDKVTSFLAAQPALAAVWTPTIAAYLDAAISSRAAAATALSTAQWSNAMAVALAEYTAARAAKIDNLDAAITTRAPASTALSTAQWTNALAADLASLETDLIAAMTSWFAARTTAISNQITGSALSIYRGDTWSQAFVVSSIADEAGLAFALKYSADDTDAQAILYVDSTGLQVLNGAAVAVADRSKGSITKTDATHATVEAHADIMAMLPNAARGVYDCQKFNANGAFTVGYGTFAVTGDVVRATSYTAPAP